MTATVGEPPTPCTGCNSRQGRRSLGHCTPNLCASIPRVSAKMRAHGPPAQSPNNQLCRRAPLRNVTPHCGFGSGDGQPENAPPQRAAVVICLWCREVDGVESVPCRAGCTRAVLAWVYCPFYCPFCDQTPWFWMDCTDGIDWPRNRLNPYRTVK